MNTMAEAQIQTQVFIETLSMIEQTCESRLN
jgi:hypothetical protein